LLKKGLTLSPGRQDLSFHLAQIYMRQQKFDLAKQTLEPLREAKDRQLKMQAESLLKSIKNYEDAMASYNSGSGAPRLQQREDKPDEVVPRLALWATRDYYGGSFISGLILAAPFGAVLRSPRRTGCPRVAGRSCECFRRRAGTTQHWTVRAELWEDAFVPRALGDDESLLRASGQCGTILWPGSRG